MSDDGASAALEILEGLIFNLAPGLTESELRRVEEIHRFRFPPDLRALLSRALPVGSRWPDWRTPESPDLFMRFSAPFVGIAADVERCGFWWPGWGDRPEDVADAVALAASALATVPRLIAIYAHRYLPAEPEIAGNPVFSVYGTDTIFYGSDLQQYLQLEFCSLPHSVVVASDKRHIRFWTDLAIEAPLLLAGETPNVSKRRGDADEPD